MCSKIRGLSLQRDAALHKRNVALHERNIALHAALRAFSMSFSLSAACVLKFSLDFVRKTPEKKPQKTQI
jgi:hypothetical protein